MSDIKLSKALSWLLRHGALKEGLIIRSDGFVRVTDVLNHKNFKDKYTIDDIKRVVQTNDKQRFILRNVAGIFEIKANQGHTIPSVNELSLTPLTESNTEVIHGTYYKFWNAIKTRGLSRMQRNHIHFCNGLPGNKEVISGMRKSAEVFVYIDLASALKDGIKFYLSENGVILTPGNSEGIIEPKYFLKVCSLSGTILLQ